MINKGDRVRVTDVVTAHYFGNERLVVHEVTKDWITFETVDSDLPSFVGQHEEFTPAEVMNLFQSGLFVLD